MWTYVVIILEVGFENLPQLSFMEYDHSIQAFSPNGTDQALDEGILPRRSRGDQFLLDAHALDPLHEDRSVDRIAVPQQILGRGVHGELPFKRRSAVQTIRGSGFASGNSQGWRVEGLGRPLSPKACRRIALGVHAPRCITF